MPNHKIGPIPLETKYSYFSTVRDRSSSSDIGHDYNLLKYRFGNFLSTRKTLCPKNTTLSTSFIFFD